MNSPVISLRISPLILAAVRAEIERLNRRPTEAPVDLTNFISVAISERLDKLARGRKKRPYRNVFKRPKQVASE